jgi:hypothetical protein
METLLDAMVKAIQDYYKVKYDIPFLDKRLRQARAFRNRILWMDAENNNFIDWAAEAIDYYIDNDYKLQQQLAEKDAENQRLRELLQRAREMHHIAYECDCVICSLWREIDEELSDD